MTGDATGENRTAPPGGRILLADQGNSLVKLTLFEGQEPVAEERFEWRRAEEALARVAEWRPDGGMFCGVGRMDAKFVESLRQLIGEGFRVFTHATPLPLRVDYTPYSGLGLDRVAAAVGAWKEGLRELTVVADAGTAITADVVAPPGVFLGGSISPGLRLRLRALHGETARLPLLDVPEDVPPAIGTSTAGSMLSGCVCGAAFELAGRCRALSAPDGRMPRLLLTGGDGPLLAAAMKVLEPDIQTELRPRLVAEGLLAIYLHRPDGDNDSHPTDNTH